MPIKKNKLLISHGGFMRDNYDFSDAVRSPIAKRLKQQITININGEVVDYFKNMSSELGIPYQTLINFYLLDCVKNKKRIDLGWK